MSAGGGGGFAKLQQVRKKAHVADHIPPRALLLRIVASVVCSVDNVLGGWLQAMGRHHPCGAGRCGIVRSGDKCSPARQSHLLDWN